MIKKAEKNDYLIIAKLANQLYSNHLLKDLEEEFKEYLSSNKTCIYIYYQNNEPIAFAHCHLRYEYVEGTISNPVAYLEGIFVKENYRNKGIAQRLVTECEQWAKEQNCIEFASDCELENKASYNFHLKSGFKEANRIICFTKKL